MNTLHRWYIYTLGDQNVQLVGCFGTYLMILVKSKGNWMVRCMCTLRFKCSWGCMFTRFVDLVLTCVLALRIICSHVYWLVRSHVFHSHLMKFTYFYVHILCWSYTSTFPCFDNHMHLCQHALKGISSLSYMP